MRHIAVLDAPSNLGLRPPTATSVPGCAKAPGALRDHGLLSRLGARDAGCLTPPRYDAGDWRPGDGVAHAAQIATYSLRLADRIGAILDAGEFPVILGGDCSILLGSGIAMHRLGEAVGGRIGLVFVDGHSDFRHPGNASYVGAAAGEDLALVTGRGQPDLAAIEGRRPYFRDIDVVVMGVRAQDEYRLDLQAAGIVTRPVPALRAEGAARSAQWAREQLADCAGYWVHVDVDVLDPAVMPAVDAPSPGGIAFPELELLLAGLVESPHCLGVELTVFDPDYDPDGEYAAEITSTVSAGLAPAGTVALRPDLAAARRDLDRTDGAARNRRRPGATAEDQPPAAASGGRGDATLSATTSPTADRDADIPATGERAVADDGEGAPSHPGEPAVDEADSALSHRGEAAVEEADSAHPHKDGAVVDEADPALSHPGQTTADEPEPALSHKGETTADEADPAPVGQEPGPADGQPGEGRLGEGVPGDGGLVDGGHAASGLGDDEPDDGGLGAGLVDAGRPGSGLSGGDLVDAGRGLGGRSGDDPGDDGLGLGRLAGGGLVDAGRPDGGVAGGGSAADGLIGGGLGARGLGAGGLGAGEIGAGGGQADRVRVDAGRPRDAVAGETASSRLLSRPLGAAPLLDSEPLPATRPGMLRPRRAEPSDDEVAGSPSPEGFSLPAQRPAFDAGSDEPADIA